jgi:hypothetical protein
MILREVEDGKAKAYSFSGMQKSRVQKKSYDNVRFAPEAHIPYRSLRERRSGPLIFRGCHKNKLEASRVLS